MADSTTSNGSAPGADSEKEARIAAMKAKIEALKAQQAGGGAPAPAAAAPKPAPASAGSAESAVSVATAPTKAAPPPKQPAAPPKSSLPNLGASTQQKPKNETDVGVWYFGRRNFLQSIGWMS